MISDTSWKQDAQFTHFLFLKEQKNIFIIFFHLFFNLFFIILYFML